MSELDIDRFHIARASGNRVKIADRKTAEGIALDLKLNLEIFLRGEVNRDPMGNGKNQWPMENQDQYAQDCGGDPRYPFLTQVLLQTGIIPSHDRSTLFPQG